VEKSQPNIKAREPFFLQNSKRSRSLPPGDDPKPKMVSYNTKANIAPIFIKLANGKSFKEMKNIEIFQIVQDLESELVTSKKEALPSPQKRTCSSTPSQKNNKRNFYN
jgi:hypothetical protein